MKQLNLLPQAVRHKAANRQSVPYMVLAGLVGLALGLTVWFGFSMEARSLDKEKEMLIADATAAQQKAAKEVADLKVSGDLKTRVNHLNTLAQADVDWDRSFEYVASLVPKDIVLSSYSFGVSQGNVTLKMTGEAPSNVSYATFAEYLKQNTGKTVTSFKVDGYVYAPQTGKVTFTVTVVAPPTAVKYPKS
ncbi:MAG TPA: hypothetical protein VLA04_04895 [Verrucomicrobiae bacterium]|nr:hypothetical protein [Verrucomicrobiae bacterium]